MVRTAWRNPSSVSRWLGAGCGRPQYFPCTQSCWLTICGCKVELCQPGHNRIILILWRTWAHPPTCQSSFPLQNTCQNAFLFVWPRYTATFLGFSTLSELALDSPHWTRRHHFSNSNFSHAKLLWNHSTAQHHRYSAKSFSHFTKRTFPHSFRSPETFSQTTVV